MRAFKCGDLLLFIELCKMRTNNADFEPRCTHSHAVMTHNCAYEYVAMLSIQSLELSIS